MKKCIICTVILFTYFGCLVPYNSNKYKQNTRLIEITGHFYKYMPYHIRLPKYTNFDSFEIESKYFDISKEKYDTLSNIFRFNIQEDRFSKLVLHDKIGNNDIVINPNTAKHPPILIELYMGMYFRSGDTISITETYNSGLTAQVINFDIDFRLTVKEFDLLTIHNGILKSIHSKGPRLNPKLMEALKSRDKHTPIIVTNIVVKSINEDVKADPLVFFVKDE